jgi:hypothetical protein
LNHSPECELGHIRGTLLAPTLAVGEPRKDTTLGEDERREAMNRAFQQACARLGLTGSTPLVELVALRILELARDGEFDPDRLADAAVAMFNS